MRYLIAIAFLAFVGCSDRPETIKGVDAIDEHYKSLGDFGRGEVTYRIITIDGCEYIYGEYPGAYNGGAFLTHKGDCKSKVHLHPAAKPSP